jgi:hypothetical protein
MTPGDPVCLVDDSTLRGRLAGRVSGVDGVTRLEENQCRLHTRAWSWAHPRGTTNVSPLTTEMSPSSIRITGSPDSTKKNSSVSRCECRVNSPCTLTTLTSQSLTTAIVAGDQCSSIAASVS